MKKQTLNLLVASAVTLAAASAQAEPTRLFSQELADVTKDLSIDVDYNFVSSGLEGGLRFGAFGGEVLVNSKNAFDLAGAGFVQPNAGFKMAVQRNVALYGIFSYHREKGPAPAGATTKESNFAFGGVYTWRQGNLLLNGNVEFVTDDNGVNGRGDENTLFFKGGAAFTLPDRRHGKMSLIGEIVAEDSDFLDTTFNVGLRWELRRNVTMDLVFVNERGDSGADTSFPGMLRLNVAF